MIKDRDGLVLASMADRFPLPHSIVAVELLVAIKALRLAQELGYNLITLEGDSKIAIAAMRSGLPSLAVYGHLLEEVKFLVRDFAAVEFSFVPRQCNTLAITLLDMRDMLANIQCGWRMFPHFYLMYSLPQWRHE